MSVKSIPFDIPIDIMKKIESGEYYRKGGVVRRSDNGQIVKHLEEVDVEDVKEGAKVLFNVASEHKVGTGLVLAGFTGLVGLGVWARKKLKKGNNLFELPECFIEYFDALGEGNLTIELIDNVLDFLNEYEDEDIIFAISPQRLYSLVSISYDYTKALAEANNVDVSEIIEPIEESDNVIDLRKYLEVQKQIFEAA